MNPLNLIRCIAARYWLRKARCFRGRHNPAGALTAVRKAAACEPDEKQVPRYLSLQGELELENGDEVRALITFRSAKAIIRTHSRYWQVGTKQGAALRIDQAIDDLERRMRDASNGA